MVAFSHASPPPESAWRVWLEPKFMKLPVAQAVPGAERVELAAGLHEGEETRPVTKEEFATLGVEWSAFFTRAVANSEAEVAKLKPRYVRDKRKVILYAEVRSERPLVATAVLAPGFRALFAETLGEKVLVVVPNRWTAFVFPRLASEYQQYAPMVFEAYRATAFPVSIELLELSAEGVKAIGAYEEGG